MSWKERQAEKKLYEDYHIQLGGVALCQDNRCHTLEMHDEIRKAGLHMTCAGNEQECKDRVKWLKKNGFDEAEVIKGRCTQWGQTYD